MGKPSGTRAHLIYHQADYRKDAAHALWSEARLSGPISLRLTHLRTWRDLQHLLAAYPDQQKGWRRHVQGQEIVVCPKTPREGIAARVTQDVDVPTNDLPRLLESRSRLARRVNWQCGTAKARGIVW